MNFTSLPMARKPDVVYAFLSELIELGAHFILCHDDKSSIGKWKHLPAILPDSFAHYLAGGLLAIIPASLSLICIDLDKGDVLPLQMLCDLHDKPYFDIRTRRGFHLWLHSSEFTFTTRKYKYGEAHGELRYQRAYVCLYEGEIEQLSRLVDTHPDPVDERFFSGFEFRTKIAMSHKHHSWGGLGGKSQVPSLRSPSNRYPIVAEKYDPAAANRNNQLNCDVYHLELFGYNIKPAVDAAAAAGLDQKEIARTVHSAVTAAREHWFYRLRTGRFNPGDLTATQVRVLQALGMFASFEDGSNCHPSQQRLASVAGARRETVNRALPVLEADGWIKQTGFVKGRPKRPTKIFEINLEKLAV